MNLKTLEKLFDYIDQAIYVEKVRQVAIDTCSQEDFQEHEEAQARLLTKANELRRLVQCD